MTKLAHLAGFALLFACCIGCSGGSPPGDASTVPSATTNAPPAPTATATVPGLSADEAEAACLEQIDSALELTLADLQGLQGAPVYMCAVSQDESGNATASLWAMVVPDLEATPNTYDNRIEQGYANSLPFDSDLTEWCIDTSELMPHDRLALITENQVWRTRLIFCDYNIEDS